MYTHTRLTPLLICTTTLLACAQPSLDSAHTAPVDTTHDTSHDAPTQDTLPNPDTHTQDIQPNPDAHDAHSPDAPTPDTSPDTSDTSPDLPPDPLTAHLSTTIAPLPFSTPDTQSTPWQNTSTTLTITSGSLEHTTLTLQTALPIRLDTPQPPAQLCQTLPCTLPLTFTYTGPPNTPTTLADTAHITLDNPHTPPLSIPIKLSALCAPDDQLPTSPTVWNNTEHTRTTTLSLLSAPYPESSTPHVLLSIPDHFDPQQPTHFTVHLHGHNAEIHEIASRQHLLHQHAFATRQSILIIPQGPLRQPSGDFGQLMLPHGLPNLLDDVQAFLYREHIALFPNPTPHVALTAHSGGYRATAAILDADTQPIAAAHLFDALYGLEDSFFQYTQRGGVLRSLYTTHGGTDDNNRDLIERLNSAQTPVATDLSHTSLSDFTCAIAHSPASHAACVRHEHTLQRFLSTSPLPPSPNAPPTLLFAIYNAETHTAHIAWDDHHADAPPQLVRVEGSHDGLLWTPLTDTTDTQAHVQPHPWFRLVTLHPDNPNQTSYASDRYGATGSQWLIVDGFDRSLDASYTLPTHGFASFLGTHLPSASFSTTSNDAIERGLVSLHDFTHVLWFLGDESTADLTFSTTEQHHLQTFLNAGGTLIVTGSEVGYATPPTFLQNTLHTRYVRDNANTLQADRFTFGVAYPEDFPDVLDGDSILWTYPSGQPAAVGWQHRIITVGFPLETLHPDDISDALQELTDWLQSD